MAWGFSWWSLSESVTDIMTIIFMIAAAGLLVRRFIQPEVRIVTTAYDYLVLIIAIAKTQRQLFLFLPCDGVGVEPGRQIRHWNQF